MRVVCPFAADAAIPRASRPTAQRLRERLASGERLLTSWSFRRLTSPAIRAAEKALAEAFESPDRLAWVDSYTDDAVFVGPGSSALEGRSALLDAAPHISISSMEIVAESTLGTGEFAAALGRVTWVSPKDSNLVRRRFRRSGAGNPTAGGASHAKC